MVVTTSPRRRKSTCPAGTRSTKIAKATVETPQPQSADASAVACSLENPGSCEACQ